MDYSALHWHSLHLLDGSMDRPTDISRGDIISLPVYVLPDVFSKKFPLVFLLVFLIVFSWPLFLLV